MIESIKPLKMTVEGEAALRARHPVKHDPEECDGCAVFAEIDALRSLVAAGDAMRRHNRVTYSAVHTDAVLAYDAARKMVTPMNSTQILMERNRDHERICTATRNLAAAIGGDAEHLDLEWAVDLVVAELAELTTEHDQAQAEVLNLRARLEAAEKALASPMVHP